MIIAKDGHPQSLTCTRRIEGPKENKMPHNDNEIFKPNPVVSAHLPLATQQLIHLAKLLSTECYRQIYPSEALIARTLLGLRKIREQRT